MIQCKNIVVGTQQAREALIKITQSPDGFGRRRVGKNISAPF